MRLTCFIMSLCIASSAIGSEIRSDEQVIFFPTLGRLSDDGSEWILPIHGWIFEPEEDDLLRNASLDWAAESLELPPGSADDQIFRERIRWFLVDNERGKEIVIEIAGIEHVMPRSTNNGHFHDELRLPADVVAAHAADGWLPFRAQVDDGDHREFTGHVHLLEPEGVIVISDIDDTIKVTEVLDHQRLLERTFLEPFEAVDGMSAVYQRWAEEGAAIHLLSNSPWQLYPDLNELFEAEAFPDSTWSMRNFRLKDRTGVEFFFGGRNHKRETIREMMEWFPEREFILIGDTAESDPEIYGDAAREFSEQVRLILLRNVTESSRDDARFEEAMRELPAEQWRLFDDAGELDDVPATRE